MTLNDEWQKQQHELDMAIVRNLINAAKNNSREKALEAYVSDVPNPEDRRGLMDAIRATRELYLSEHETA